MKTFLTLLVAITSLSAYTLVGVHACAICSTARVNGASFYTGCTDEQGITNCYYWGGGKSPICRYNHEGALQPERSAYGCQGTVSTGNACPLCN